MGGGSIKNPSSSLLPSHLRSQTALRLCASTFGRAQTLQRRQKRPTAPVVFYLFDLLWSDGRDITGKTVLQRRDRLEQIINPVPGIQVGGYIENRGIDLYRLAKEKGVSPTKVRKVPQDSCQLPWSKGF